MLDFVFFGVFWGWAYLRCWCVGLPVRGMDLELTWLQSLKVVLVRGAVALGLGFWHWQACIDGDAVWFPE